MAIRSTSNTRPDDIGSPLSESAGPAMHLGRLSSAVARRHAGGSSQSCASCSAEHCRVGEHSTFRTPWPCSTVLAVALPKECLVPVNEVRLLCSSNDVRELEREVAVTRFNLTRPHVTFALQVQELADAGHPIPALRPAVTSPINRSLTPQSRSLQWGLSIASVHNVIRNIDLRCAFFHYNLSILCQRVWDSGIRSNGEITPAARAATAASSGF